MHIKVFHSFKVLLISTSEFHIFGNDFFFHSCTRDRIFSLCCLAVDRYFPAGILGVRKSFNGTSTALNLYTEESFEAVNKSKKFRVRYLKYSLQFKISNPVQHFSVALGLQLMRLVGSKVQVGTPGLVDAYNTMALSIFRETGCHN